MRFISYPGFGFGWWKPFQEHCTWVTVERNSWDKLFLLLMSLWSAVSLTVRLQPNNSLWGFKEKISQTFLLGQCIWAELSGTYAKEEGWSRLTVRPRSVQSYKRCVSQKTARVPVLTLYSKYEWFLHSSQQNKCGSIKDSIFRLMSQYNKNSAS